MSADRGAVAAEKAALRRRMIVARAALPAPARQAASRRIARRLAALPELSSARAILGYAAFGAEVDLDAYLAARIAGGTAVYLPWVEGDNLHIARVRDLRAGLGPGWRGVREPLAGHRRAAGAAAVDAVVAPGVAFDRDGHRLGYGGGHFDRMLARLAAGSFVVGVAFDAQLVDAVPVEAHDASVDAVVTESRTMRAGG